MMLDGNKWKEIWIAYIYLHGTACTQLSYALRRNGTGHDKRDFKKSQARALIDSMFG